MPEDTDRSQTERIRLDQLLLSASNSTRRSILTTLAESNPRDMEELTSPDFEADGDELEIFEAEVTYDHLPALDRAGLIEWDRETDTITRGQNFEEVRPLITLIHEHRDELPDDWLQQDR